MEKLPGAKSKDKTSPDLEPKKQTKRKDKEKTLKMQPGSWSPRKHKRKATENTIWDLEIKERGEKQIHITRKDTEHTTWSAKKHRKYENNQTHNGNCSKPSKKVEITVD